DARRAPREPGRWLLAEVRAPRPFALGAMHVPNRITGRKWPFLDGVLAVAEAWRGGPALLVGDTHSGRPGIDEEPAGFNAREGTGGGGGVGGGERGGGKVDGSARARGLAGRVPPSPRAGPRLHVVLAERGEWLPDRPGLHQPRAAAEPLWRAPHLGPARDGAG